MTLKVGKMTNVIKRYFVMFIVLTCASLLLIIMLKEHGGVNESIVHKRQSEPSSKMQVVQRNYSQLENTSYPYHVLKALQGLSTDFKTFWLYFRSVIKQAKFDQKMKNVDDGYAAANGILQKLMKESETDVAGEIVSMSEFVRTEFERLQYPRNCEETRVLVAQLVLRRCGFGCAMHSIVLFMMKAFKTNRTLVLRSKGWSYAAEGWDYAFLPLSNCSYEGNADKLPTFNEQNTNERIVFLRSLEEEWIHWTIPRELESSLKKVHGDPYAWWIGQFVAFIMRLQPWLKEELQSRAKEIRIHDGVAGVQVRWGDKLGEEAKRIDVDEYMIFVESWFQQLDYQGVPNNKTVYLASEEKEVWEEMKRKYPKYKFVGNGPAAWEPKPDPRYKHEGLMTILSDIYLLTQCSYVVCTHSSNVCRTVYELMNYQGDASLKVQSTDNVFFFRLGSYKPMVAEMDHEASEEGEISFQKGDVIMMEMNPFLPHNDGYVRGTNKRTNKNGKFLQFKTREIVKTYNERVFKADW